MIELVIALFGGALYRWRGKAHKWKKYILPRPLNQIAFATPYMAVCWPVLGWGSLAVLVVTTLAVLTGHGRGMSLREPLRGEPDTLEFVVSWAQPYLPVYWYKALLLAVTGLAVTLPAGIVLMNPLIALSGILKAVAYMIGWEFFRHEVATARGEFFTGFFLWSALAWMT